LALGSALSAGVLDPCPGNGSTIADIQALSDGSCYINDKLFSGFEVTGDLHSSDFTIAQIFDNPPAEIGFQWQLSLSAGPGQHFDVSLSYIVATLSGLPLIDDADLVIAGSYTYPGFATVGENVCPGYNYIGGCSPPLYMNAYFGPVTQQTSDHVDFAPVSVVAIEKDIAVNGGADGFADLSLLTQTVSQTGIPEPLSLLLMGSGLLALGVIRKRKSA